MAGEDIDLEAIFGREPVTAARAEADQRMAAATEIVREAFLVEKQESTLSRVTGAVALSHRITELSGPGATLPALKLAVSLAKCAGEIGVQLVDACRRVEQLEAELAALKAGQE